MRTRAEINAYRRAYYAANSEGIRRVKREWYDRNRTSYLAATRLRQNAMRRERKERLIAALGGRCMDCGQTFPGHPEVFEFDHRNPNDKFDGIARMLGWGWERLVEEVMKCDLVCANCHRVRTSARGWGNAKEMATARSKAS